MAIESVGDKPAQEPGGDPVLRLVRADLTTQLFRAAANSSRSRTALSGEKYDARPSPGRRPNGSPVPSGPITGWEYGGRRLNVLNPEGPDGADRDNRLYVRGDHTATIRGSYLAPEPLSESAETVIPHVTSTIDGGWEICELGSRPGPRYVGTGNYIRAVRGGS